MNLKLLACLIAAAAVSGCDVTNTLTASPPPDSRAMVIFENAGTDSVLLVNGRTVGRAAEFGSERRALRLDQGIHRIEVRAGSEQLLVQSVAVTDGSVERLSIPASARHPQAAPQ